MGWWVRGTGCPPLASSERALKALAVTSRPPARGQMQVQTVAPVCFALCLLTLLPRCLEEQDLFSRRILHRTLPAPESSVSPAGPAPAPPGDLPTLPARDPLGCLASPTGCARPRPQGHLMESETRAGWVSELSLNGDRIRTGQQRGLGSLRTQEKAEGRTGREPFDFHHRRSFQRASSCV